MPNLDELVDAQLGQLLYLLMAHRDPVSQRRAAFELGRRSAPEATGLLLRLLTESRDSQVRAAAAEALAQIGDDCAGEDLLRVFLDPQQPREVRDTCAYALGRLHFEPALDPLFGALRDTAPSVRRCALSAIVAIGGESAIERLALISEIEKDAALKAEMRAIIAGQQRQRRLSFAADMVRDTNPPPQVNGLVFSLAARNRAA